jgi:hypothetical protein
MTLDELRTWAADDFLAATHQSMGQYRNALLRAIDEVIASDVKIDPRVFQAETVYEQEMAGVVGAGPSMANEAASVAQGLTMPQMEMLRALLVSIRPEYGTPGSRDLEVGRQQMRIDAALAILAQAAPPAAPVQGDVVTRGSAFAAPATGESGAIFAKVREAIRLADQVGRSRQANNAALNRCAVEKLVDLEMEIEAALRATPPASVMQALAAPASEAASQPGEMGAGVPMRGESIAATWSHDAGAYARCSYCGRYSDNPHSLMKDSFPCDCGKLHGWSGSFKKPTAESKWSDAK